MYALATNPYEQQGDLSFQVVASDKELLGKLTHLLQAKGYVGLWDHSGSMRFLVDGRQNVYRCAEAMTQYMTKLSRASELYLPQGTDLAEVERFLGAYGFPKGLKGTQYLAYMIYRLKMNPKLLRCLSKGIYQEAADYYATDSKLVERSLRYAVQKSQLSGLSNLYVLHLLVSQLARGESDVSSVSGDYKQLRLEGYGGGF